LKNGLGGIIYFTRDIESKEQFASLIKEHKSKALIPLFLSIDQEGGRVERTENIHERYLSPRFAYQKGEEFLEEREKKEEEYFDKLAPEDTIFYRPLRPTNVFLKKKMPLFIEYFTCYVDFNGDINYRPDLYEKEGNVLYLLRKLEH
jgi:hypothetical protein